jgi:glycosyltransferase involved in cell wall biosynthesis
LCTAKAETFHNVAVGARACGTPVVATRVGRILEQVEEYLGWYAELMGRNENGKIDEERQVGKKGVTYNEESTNYWNHWAGRLVPG